MNRCIFVIVLATLTVLPLRAQAPIGWKVRADNSTSASDPDAPGDIKFATSGAGFHATNPRAAVFWNPRNTAAGQYSVKGTFTLLEPSNHTNYYGLVFGGRDLDGPRQQYLYFLVAQDGTWLVKRRDGDATTNTVLPKTASSAVRKPDASGRSVNVLEVRVLDGAIEFVANGTVLDRWSRPASIVRTDGTYGIRVNHFLDVEIEAFGAAPASPTTTAPSPGPPEPPAAETVALTAPLGRMLSPTTFLLKQGRERGAREIALVVAPTLQRPIDRAVVVTVFGTAMPLDTPEIAARIGKDVVVDPGGQAILATAVLDPKMVDLTKPLPPPATAAEQSLDRLMKRISPAFASLRQAAEAADAAAVAKNAGTLEQAFAEVEAFWNARSRPDATAWAHTARLEADAIAHGAPNTTDDVKGAVAALGQQCQTCHMTYREQFADGAFRIKMPR
jgi:hypothetical protein